MAPGRKALFGLIAALALLVCACTPEATPLPSILPTIPAPTGAASSASTPTPLRYALAPNLVPYFPDEIRQELGANATIILLDAPPNPADLGTRYDIAVAFGGLPGGNSIGALFVNVAVQPALIANSPDVYSVIASAASPARIADVLTEALAISGVGAPINPTAMPLDLRVKLANAGYPDGLDITLAASAYAPGAQQVAQLLAAVNIEARITDLAAAAPNTMQLVLDTYYDHDDAFDYTSLGTYSIPISYLAAPGQTFIADDGGFPVAKRSG